MARYKIWDRQEDVCTIKSDKTGKSRWTAQEYIEKHAPWASNPDIKVIVGGEEFNGTAFMRFDQTLEYFKTCGAGIRDSMTDEEKLAVIEEFEDTRMALSSMHILPQGGMVCFYDVLET